MLAPLIALVVAAVPQLDQVDQAWGQDLLHPTLAGYAPIDVEAAPGGGLVVVGSARPLPLNQINTIAEIVVTRFDENGDVLWTQSINSAAAPQSSVFKRRYADSIVAADGTVFVVTTRTNRSWLWRFGPDGQLEGQTALPLRAIPGTSGWQEYRARQVLFTPTGDVVVSGVAVQDGYPRLDVRAFTESLVSLWEWRGDGGVEAFSSAAGEPACATFGLDGTLYVGGSTDFRSFTGFAFSLLVALTPSGDLAWRRTDPPTYPLVSDVKIDAQGNPVALYSVTEDFNGFAHVVKLLPDGTEVFATEISFNDMNVQASAIAIDSLGRISVAGARAAYFSSEGTPTLFRIDASGNYVGFETPSAALSGVDGRLFDVRVIERKNVVALGVTGTSSDQLVLSRFAPEGAERWSVRRKGRRPSDSAAEPARLGLTTDDRGNLFTLAWSIESGTFPDEVQSLRIAKEVQAGPAGAAYCTPAVANSTSLPASLSALGPATVILNNVTLRADNLPLGSLTLFLTSQTQGTLLNVGGGQGTLCLGGAIGRFVGPGQVRTADGSGSASLQLDLTGLPLPSGLASAAVGETWSFQAWYRDANPSPTSNLTDGIAVLMN